MPQYRARSRNNTPKTPIGVNGVCLYFGFKKFDRSVTVARGLSLLFCASKEAKPRTGKPRGMMR
ncbi:hypothetical protein SLEP1_g3739 [Rubroshorea leprosula]|uniref:Uncharacterized protein n=1 Tax=Rubroshorea leprosula TaxID=152421 RepID=A0AAV5HQR7_9ROSI|nr:hypothetical protein SLEP1_g3739 [Rubroshorea leprosula]